MSPAMNTAETPRDHFIPESTYPFGAFALGAVLGVRPIPTPEGERSRAAAN